MNVNSSGPTLAQVKYWTLVGICVLFLAALAGVAWAESRNNVGLAQGLAVVAICLVVMGVLAAATPSSYKAVGNNESAKTADERLAVVQRKFDDWLLRLVIVTALGLCVIVLYSIQWLNDRCLAIAGVALLAAGASWLVGLIVGFLFGIPHLSSANPDAGKSPSAATPEQLAAGANYSPSTSLEQVADWLTKIIVGVGLTQLNKIPHNLYLLAAYIGTGMGDGTVKGDAPSHNVFALSICMYFLSCGFLFGFLWARLYMEEAFHFASLFKALFQRLLPRAPGGPGGEGVPDA